MCFKKEDKWRKFEPCEEYFKIVEEITSVAKLYEKLREYMWQKEKSGKDYWKTPWEFLKSINIPNDCEDFARFALDILVRVIKKIKARFIIFSGYNEKRSGKELKAHAIVVFPWFGKLAVFSNNRFKSGFENYLDIGHWLYPQGLKSMEVRNYLGEVVEKIYKWFGTF